MEMERGRLIIDMIRFQKAQSFLGVDVLFLNFNVFRRLLSMEDHTQLHLQL